ncbi:transcription termination/antitermination NusG family protein [Polaribacter porphyrae]|uniref:NusG-like N-terminal domain-containing protein n=1 Tax=Polaribacter porphyrae TaxID=1137780 RepID=A0A2S7WJJ2_9FLAO|nr:transcription termination/antitermination NusG family protein [Polaribacter porphyrae]PQJ77753.1 hypothetical protein BTO18_00490 [Polaribacter porphyrae]
MNTKNWFVLHTKPRNELKVTERLSAIGIEVYAPTRLEVRQWSDRSKKVEVPLLPSMVLVHLDEQDTSKVFQVTGVVRYLFEQGKRACISNDEVLAMKCYLENKFNIEVKNLSEGDIINVPLLNQDAKILKLQGKKCMARLQSLGAVVSFQLS